MDRFVPSALRAQLSPCPWTLLTLLSFCLSASLIAGCAVDLRDGDIPNDEDDVITEPDDDDDVITDDDDTSESDDDDASGDDDDDDSTPEPTLFAPLGGDWVIVTAQLTLDECGLEGFMDRGQPGSVFQLANTASSTFDLTFGGDKNQTSGGGEVLPCSLIGSSRAYECGSSLSERDLTDEFGLDAVLPVEMSAWGEFTSETIGSLTTQVDLSCVGSNCTLVGLLLGTSFPCTMVNSTEVEPTN